MNDSEATIFDFNVTMVYCDTRIPDCDGTMGDCDVTTGHFGLHLVFVMQKMVNFIPNHMIVMQQWVIVM